MARAVLYLLHMRLHYLNLQHLLRVSPRASPRWCSCTNEVALGSLAQEEQIHFRLIRGMWVAHLEDKIAAGLLFWATAYGLLCPVASAGSGPGMVANILAGGGVTLTKSVCVIDSSLGEVAGTVSNASSGLLMKTGYAGQLVNTVSISVHATPLTVNEEGTSLLTAVATYDDNTRVVPDVAWYATSGPIAAVDPDGTVHAGAIYQDTPARVEARHPSATGVVFLTVLDVLKDNYGTYAMDGIADAWQVLHFGTNNLDAAAAADSDHDGQTNYFEYVAGTLPTNPLSFFTMRIEKDSFTNQARIVMDPTYGNRSYWLLGNTNLVTGSWQVKTDVQAQTNGTELSITDLSASNAVQFYRAGIRYAGE